MASAQATEAGTVWPYQGPKPGPSSIACEQNPGKHKCYVRGTRRRHLSTCVFVAPCLGSLMSRPR
eukprot:5177817-Heterocapsa_arctica.AAC.1